MQLKRRTRIAGGHRLPEGNDVAPDECRVDRKTSVGSVRQVIRPQFAAQEIERPSQGRATVVFVQLGPERSEQLVAAEAHPTAPQQDVGQKGKSFRLLPNGARVTFPHRQDRGTKD